MSTGGQPFAIAAGDLDGDGDLDLATVDSLEEFGGAISVFSNQDGSFVGGGGLAPEELRSPSSLTVGDFNGDGFQDLAFIDFGGNVLISLQRSSSSAPIVSRAGPGANSVTVGDFNGDGRQDLAIPHGFVPPGSVSILLGRGDGTFQAPLDVVAGPLPGSIAAGDFNGDGQQDLATANVHNQQGTLMLGSVSILLGQGNGTFEPTQDFDVGARPESVTVGDFNGDGRQDVATANFNANSVSVLINNTGGAVAYRVTRIGDEVFSPIISDINEIGEMVGSTRGIAEPRRAILLRDGEVVELGDLVGGAALSASATAISDLSEVIGTNDIEDASGKQVSRGFLWQFGRISGFRDGEFPLDINNRRDPPGEIVGFSVSAENLVRPFFAGREGFTFLDELVCLGNPGGIARALNDSGVIVGSSNSPAGTRAVIWKEGRMGGITPLQPPFPLETGEAVDVNGRGDAIGFYFNSSGPQMHTALLWQADDVTVLPPLDHPEANAAIPESINNQGEIVGSTHLGSGQSIATLWRANAALDVNELISDDDPAKSFVTLAFAIKITDSGLIVASGADSRDAEPRNNVYFLLRPTGAPASFAAVPRPSPSPPPPTASSPPPSDSNGGGAVDLLSLLLLILALSSVSWHRARSRVVGLSR